MTDCKLTPQQDLAPSISNLPAHRDCSYDRPTQQCFREFNRRNNFHRNYLAIQNLTQLSSKTHKPTARISNFVDTNA
jgi:hypothetical protein